MSENRYIILNCPAYNNHEDFSCRNGAIEPLLCQDCTGCVMKQIVELCKYTCLTERHLIHKSSTFNLANGILQKLDIEEVE